ncbi:inosine 5-monophosphate dehydrogenase [Candidatus Uhrbacteria bacterium RIFOXYA2_FULL_40_9]|nr:MAG: IMP dehydrogenase related 1 [Candidatus Uhrbacteria bacterium GW2011_GWF2_40_263]OGL93778.1 MAG: inosine 5-monophosphate dehydrogenase [Candidatus Uhrbacteria bacterium RIFOXYA2_FULL_40_9]OGL97441.1 MAG: inosine 5-monophosphate dehydrogenase [Candidatus Uhrbacteria bacterium RIFOXYB2_FULL_41_18]HBK34801.1 GuaB1 family IMP dehydrogenase-related protein [Candidatus Uhrbacteria bacterium]HCB56123.1 GuaB1 family IMP dehydrogenase-related protein [Candidatus Uhrbacteria bacterium]
MQFFHPHDVHRELTYQDVFLFPAYSEVGSRMNVDLHPKSCLPLTLPLVVSNMNSVAGKRMAETVTRRGGLVVLPQDKPMSYLKEVVRSIKTSHPVFETSVTLEETESIQTALNLINKRSHGAVVVIDVQRRPVGIFTEKDARQKDRYLRLSQVMTRNLETLEDTVSLRDAYATLEKRRLKILPVVDDQGVLKGVLTRKGILRSTWYQPSLNTSQEFYTAAAVGVNGDLQKKVETLLEMGVDLIVLDTAHGHQKRMLEAIRFVRGLIGNERPLCAGNIVTEQAAVDFLEAGANILKVGVGPGAACTTRMVTGMGRPQFSAVYHVSQMARQAGGEVWADGGCRHPRDVVLALAAGAHCAMIGSWFAGTYESPADVQRDGEGKLFKEHFGMASSRAVSDRTEALEPFDQDQKRLFAEGISQGKMSLKEGEESVEDCIDLIVAGLRSACSYAGANDLEELYEKAIVGVQTLAGFREGQAVPERW